MRIVIKGEVRHYIYIFISYNVENTTCSSKTLFCKFIFNTQPSIIDEMTIATLHSIFSIILLNIYICCIRYLCLISILTIAYMLLNHNSPTGDDGSIILYGDNQGCINILIFKNTAECLRYLSGILNGCFSYYNC